jgi:hypothetical protein
MVGGNMSSIGKEDTDPSDMLEYVVFTNSGGRGSDKYNYMYKEMVELIKNTMKSFITNSSK